MAFNWKGSAVKICGASRLVAVTALLCCAAESTWSQGNCVETNYYVVNTPVVKPAVAQVDDLPPPSGNDYEDMGMLGWKVYVRETESYWFFTHMFDDDYEELDWVNLADFHPGEYTPGLIGSLNYHQTYGLRDYDVGHVITIGETDIRVTFEATTSSLKGEMYIVGKSYDRNTGEFIPATYDEVKEQIHADAWDPGLRNTDADLFLFNNRQTDEKIIYREHHDGEPYIPGNCSGQSMVLMYVVVAWHDWNPDGGLAITNTVRFYSGPTVCNRAALTWPKAQSEHWNEDVNIRYLCDGIYRFVTKASAEGVEIRVEDWIDGNYTDAVSAMIHNVTTAPPQDVLHTVTASCSYPGFEVVISNQPADDDKVGVGQYESGTTVALRVQPDGETGHEFLFQEWSGEPEVEGLQTPEISLVVNRDMAIVAKVEPYVTISGRLTDMHSQDPIPNVTISLIGLTTGTTYDDERFTAVTAADGTYTLRVPVGDEESYNMVLSSPDVCYGTQYIEVPFVPTQGQTLNPYMSGQCCSISGVVTDAADGEPIQGAAVSIQGLVTLSAATTDAAGAYTLTGIPYRDGTYTAVAHAAGYVQGVYPDIPGNTRGMIADVDFTLQKGYDFAISPSSYDAANDAWSVSVGVPVSFTPLYDYGPRVAYAWDLHGSGYRTTQVSPDATYVNPTTVDVKMRIHVDGETTVVQKRLVATCPPAPGKPTAVVDYWRDGMRHHTRTPGPGVRQLVDYCPVDGAEVYSLDGNRTRRYSCGGDVADIVAWNWSLNGTSIGQQASVSAELHTGDKVRLWVRDENGKEHSIEETITLVKCSPWV